MNTAKWFEKKFNFTFGMEKYDGLYKRLESAPIRYKHTVASLSNELLIAKSENEWSIKENIGHLVVLEALWQKRFKEIIQSIPEMSPADLNNTLTNESNFNHSSISYLLESFITSRAETVSLLDSFLHNDFTKSSVHPRLKQPMRVIDLMLFIAEHDDHHFATIQEILKRNNELGK